MELFKAFPWWLWVLLGLCVVLPTISKMLVSADVIGRHGEKLVERELKLVRKLGRKGKILRNIYVPKQDGGTSEIDVVYITQKGIFVIESKNYSGWIFGDERQQMWTQSLPNKQKEKFYNPIIQNKTHVKWLDLFLGHTIPLFSIIVFSERCELKKVTYTDPGVVVIKRDELYRTIRSIWDHYPDVISEEKVDAIDAKLRVLTQVDEVVKMLHVESIQNRFGSNQMPSNNRGQVSVSSQPGMCPKCGKALILRTVKQGPNAGRQFYGCSGFPQCRYMRKIENEGEI